MSGSGRVHLVTGGTHGIGAACVRRLAAEGHTVVFTGRDVDAGKALAASFERVHFEPGDATNEADCRRAVAAAAALGGGAVHGLVANAGIAARQRFEDATLADWNRVMGVNATASFLFARHALAALRAGRGAAVMVSSIAGLVG